MENALNNLPVVKEFFGLDLKTASYVIAALGVAHPFIFGCTFFLRLSYLLLTIWIMIIAFSVFSVVLFYGISNNHEGIITSWVWFAMVFVGIMAILMIMLCIVFCRRRQSNLVFLVLVAILLYAALFYCSLIVNSYRKGIHTVPKFSKLSRLSYPSKMRYKLMHCTKQA